MQLQVCCTVIEERNKQLKDSEEETIAAQQNLHRSMMQADEKVKKIGDLLNATVVVNSAQKHKLSHHEATITRLEASLAKVEDRLAESDRLNGVLNVRLAKTEMDSTNLTSRLKTSEEEKAGLESILCEVRVDKESSERK